MNEKADTKTNNQKIVDYSKTITVEGLPDGMRAFIKDRNIPVGQDFTAYLYRLKKEPGQTKLRRFYKEKMLNEFYEGDYDEQYIKEAYGGGEFQVVYAWKMPDGSKGGIDMEPIFIDGPPKDDLPNMRQKAEKAEEPPRRETSAGPGLEGSPFSIENLLKLVPLITAAKELFSNMIPKPDYSIIEKVQESQIKSLEKFGSQLQKMQMESFRNKIEQLDKIEEAEPMKESNFEWPEWLKPFSGLIEGYAERLLGNNPLATALKKTLVKNEIFQKCWNDEKKREEAVNALAGYFGEETAEALEEAFDKVMEPAH